MTAQGTPWANQPQSWEPKPIQSKALTSRWGGPSLERDSGHQLPGTVLEFPSEVLDSLESDGFPQVTYPL